MSPSQADPWPVIVRLDEVGKRLDRHLVADATDRARIAEALGLQALNALEAEVTVTQTGTGGEVRGDLHAKVVQICGVSLEPFETDIRSAFAVPFTTAPAARTRSRNPGVRPGRPGRARPDPNGRAGRRRLCGRASGARTRSVPAQAGGRIRSPAARTRSVAVRGARRAKTARKIERLAQGLRQPSRLSLESPGRGAIVRRPQDGSPPNRGGV